MFILICEGYYIVYFFLCAPFCSVFQGLTASSSLGLLHNSFGFNDIEAWMLHWDRDTLSGPPKIYPFAPSNPSRWH